VVKFQRGGAALDPFEWPERVAIADLFQALGYQFAGVSMALGLEFRQQLPGAALHVLFDRESLADVISSLVHNAFSVCERGGEVRLSAQALDGRCVIRVADTGPGIAAGDRERIFARDFARRGRESFSLNLYQLRQVVESAQGRVRAENLPGGGACFTITLPLARPA